MTVTAFITAITFIGSSEIEEMLMERGAYDTGILALE
jgi:hypothetical protein